MTGNRAGHLHWHNIAYGSTLDETGLNTKHEKSSKRSKFLEQDQQLWVS
jgi:hypothetical protein